MDLADRASRIEAAERASGIEKAMRKANGGVGRAVCVDCEGEIEPARRVVLRSAQRCLDCQTLRERLTP